MASGYLWFRGAVLGVVLGISGSARAQAASAGDQKLLAETERIAAVVAKLRGLALKQPIKRAVLERTQLLGKLKARISQDYSPKELRGEELALKRLGLLPASTDYLQLILDTLTQQIAGYYDPFERQLYLLAGTQAGGEFVMSHEIGHALQDQHFDLKKFLTEAKRDNDQLVARQALVEGDGLAISLEYTMAAVGQQVPWGQEGFTRKVSVGMTAAMASMSEVPLVLRESLTFPYSAGTAFVGHFRKHHAWSRVDQIYKQPPLSTEQVMHPKKYEEFERPHTIKTAALPSLAGYEQAFDTTFGELATTILFKQHGLSATEAGLAAAGWGGDRVLVYTPPGHQKGLEGVIAIVFSSWDSEADAMEYVAGLEKASSSLGGGAVVKRQDSSVALVVGAAADRANPLVDEVLKTFKTDGVPVPADPSPRPARPARRKRR